MSVPVLPENWEVATSKERYDNYCLANKLTNSSVSSMHHEVVVFTSACKYILNLFFTYN